MKTEIENKKTIEQEALDSYSWQIAKTQANILSRNIAFITAGLTILSFCIYNVDSPLWLQLWVDITGAILAIFILLIIGFFSGGTIFILYFAFITLYYYSDRYKVKIVSSLSEEARKRITREYIGERIVSWKKNIKYCQRIVDDHQKSIDHSDHQIHVLTVELQKI